MRDNADNTPLSLRLAHTVVGRAGTAQLDASVLLQVWLEARRFLFQKQSTALQARVVVVLQ